VVNKAACRPYRPHSSNHLWLGLTASAQRARWRKIAAVIGCDFSYSLLRAVAGMDDLALQATVYRLAEADIVLVQGVPPQSEHRFKHALIQDAAYENLLKSRRQVLHRRVAETLRDQFAASATGPFRRSARDSGTHRMPLPCFKIVVSRPLRSSSPP
jgi:hypothetical protein